MKVRVCPKCQVQNRATNAACSGCYASLEGVAVTEAEAPQIKIQNPPPPRAPRPASPAGPQAPAPTQQMPQASPLQPGPIGPAPTQQFGAPQQTQMGATPPPPGAVPTQGMPAPGIPGQGLPPHQGLAPVKKKSPVGTIALVLSLVVVVFGGIGFALVQSGLLKPEPRPTESVEGVALKFLEAKKSEDYGTIKPYLTEASVEKLNSTMYNSRQAQSAGFGTQDSSNMLLFSQDPEPKALKRGGPVTAKEVKDPNDPEANKAVVKVHVEGKGAPPGASEADEDYSLLEVGPVDCELVFVAEGGHWKYDIEETDLQISGEGKKKKGFKWK